MACLRFEQWRWPLVGFALALFIAPAHAHGTGLYSTQAEAEQQAKVLGCRGAYPVNGKWMPCANEQELHQALRHQ